MKEKQTKKESVNEDLKKKLLQLFSVDLTKHSAIPVFTEQKNGDLVYWGKNRHDYPMMLIELFMKSPVHGRIIKAMAQAIAGKEIIIAGGSNNYKLEAFLQKVNNKGEGMHDIIIKCASDFKKFGSFALQIIYSRDKTSAELYHVDFSTIVMGKKDEDGNINTVYISDNWQTPRPKYKAFPVFNPEEPGGSQIYFYQPYTAGCSYYPTPDYLQGLGAIEIDTKIVGFWNSLISTGFFPSVFIDLPGGIPATDEEADELVEGINKQWGSEANAGKMIVNFSNSKEDSPTLTVLPTTDLDKMFTTIESLIEKKIIQAHGVISPVLAAVQTAGSLGQRNELIDANELQYNEVIKPKAKIIESEISWILHSLGFTDSIEILPNTPLSTKYSEAVLMEVMTKDEIRTSLGLPSIEDEAIQDKTPLAELIGVGGTQSFISIMQSELTPQQKINTITLLFGIREADAAAMVNGTPLTNNQTINPNTQ